ncbi:unnamed protein product [Choristocarpus tenellus]
MQLTSFTIKASRFSVMTLLHVVIKMLAPPMTPADQMPGPGRRGPPGPRPGPPAPRPAPAPFRGPPRGGGLGGFVAGLAAGATVAAVTRRPPPPPRRNPPPPGHIIVLERGQPRVVLIQETPFILKRVALSAFEMGQDGVVFYPIQVTTNDGVVYVVKKRYSQFDNLRGRVAHLHRASSHPFAPKQGLKSSTMGLREAELEERRCMLQAWLQGLINSAQGSPVLRAPIYDFLETTAHYPPVAGATTANDNAQATAVALPVVEPALHHTATAVSQAEAVSTTPFIPSVKVAEASWGVSLESMEESDTQMAVHGPDSLGRLSPQGAKQALLATGAGEADLRRIWELSDIDKDGFLDRDEFALAWFLSKKSAAGNPPPPVLPPDLIPPSKRAAPASSSNPF